MSLFHCLFRAWVIHKISETPKLKIFGFCELFMPFLWQIRMTTEVNIMISYWVVLLLIANHLSKSVLTHSIFFGQEEKIWWKWSQIENNSDQERVCGFICYLPWMCHVELRGQFFLQIPYSNITKLTLIVSFNKVLLVHKKPTKNRGFFCMTMFPCFTDAMILSKHPKIHGKIRKLLFQLNKFPCFNDTKICQNTTLKSAVFQ